jgi:PAS domain S-box-containing protein
LIAAVLLIIPLFVYQTLQSDPSSPSAGQELIPLVKIILWVGGGFILILLLRFFLSRASDEKVPEKGKEERLLANTFQDVIHQLKQKERVLERLNEDTQAYALTILQNVTSGVAAFDCDGKVITFNPAAEAILGMRQEAVLGRAYEEAFAANPAFVASVQETLVQKGCDPREKNVLRKESDAVRSDGKKITLGLTASPLLDQTGATIGVMVVFSDLTEMKVLQEQLDLKKRLVLMGEMSAFIAHEFRNYMGTILGFASMLSKEFTPNDPGSAMTVAIIRELSTMEALITDLLSYGKNPALTLKNTAVIPLIQDALEAFQSKGTYETIRFITKFQPCDAEIDPILMRQALSNLIRNALEAMALEGTSSPGKLTVTAGYLGDRFVEIKISNTGKGIAADQRDKIFLPFFTTKEKGSGLGLALVQRIILAHNGTISVESHEDTETTFMMTVPITPPAKGATPVGHVAPAG